MSGPHPLPSEWPLAVDAVSKVCDCDITSIIWTIGVGKGGGGGTSCSGYVVHIDLCARLTKGCFPLPVTKMKCLLSVEVPGLPLDIGNVPHLDHPCILCLCPVPST